MDPNYPFQLALLIIFLVGGYVAHRQFEDAKSERRQLIKAIDFLEREIARIRERLPLSEDERKLLDAITKSEWPDRSEFE